MCDYRLIYNGEWNLKTPVPIRCKNTNGKNLLLILVFKPNGGTKEEDVKEKIRRITRHAPTPAWRHMAFLCLFGKEQFVCLCWRVDAAWFSEKKNHHRHHRSFEGKTHFNPPTKEKKTVARPEEMKKIHEDFRAGKSSFSSSELFAESVDLYLVSPLSFVHANSLFDFL